MYVAPYRAHSRIIYLSSQNVRWYCRCSMYKILLAYHLCSRWHSQCGRLKDYQRSSCHILLTDIHVSAACKRRSQILHHKLYTQLHRLIANNVIFYAQSSCKLEKCERLALGHGFGGKKITPQSPIWHVAKIINRRIKFDYRQGKMCGWKRNKNLLKSLTMQKSTSYTNWSSQSLCRIFFLPSFN